MYVERVAKVYVDWTTMEDLNVEDREYATWDCDGTENLYYALDEIRNLCDRDDIEAALEAIRDGEADMIMIFPED